MGFWKGAFVGGIAGAAYGVWTAPLSGSEFRDGIVDTVENRLIKLTGMEVWTPDEASNQPAHEWLAGDPESGPTPKPADGS